MPVIMEVSVVPVGTQTASLGDFVAETIKVARRHGLKHQLNAMGTNLEGNLDPLLAAAKDMHQACFQKGAQRVVTILKIDERRDKDLDMDYKVRSVLEKVGG